MAYLRLYPVAVRRGIKQLALPLDRRCLVILRDHAASVIRAGCSSLHLPSMFAPFGNMLCDTPLPR
jgi:hypothetical protein